MTHRVETIMQALVTTVTGLATTGSRVYRGRAYAVPAADANAIRVWQGADVVDEDSMFHRLKSILIVKIEPVLSETTAQVDETLNTIRREVAAAIGAAVNLGLAFEITALEQRAEEPDVDGFGDSPRAAMPMVWAIEYWRNRADPAN